MKKLFIIGLILVGCSQNSTERPVNAPDNTRSPASSDRIELEQGRGPLEKCQSSPHSKTC